METDTTPEIRGANAANALDFGVHASDKEQPGWSRKQLSFHALPQWWILAALAIAALGISAFVFVRLSSASTSTTAVSNKPSPVATVSVESASFKLLPRHLEVTGSIWAWDPLSIGSEINGLRIGSVDVEEGDSVRKGQTLATLNSSVISAQLEQARARLRSSEASLLRAIQPNRPEDIRSLRAAVEEAEANVAQREALLVQAQANLANAEQNARRFQDLAKQGAVSQLDAENRQTTAQTSTALVHNAQQAVVAAKFALEQSKQRLAMAELGGRREDVEISKATVAEQRASVQQLEAQLAQTVIRAPADGLIYKRDAHIGDITAVNKSLFSLMRDHRLELRADVPEIDLQKIQPGASVHLCSYADSSLSINGRVRELCPLVDSSTRMGTVRIDLPFTSKIRPGMFVRGEVDLGQSSTLTVPARAVLTRDNQSFLFTLNGDKARRQEVKVGTRTEQLAEIVSGVSAGQPVIIDGAGFLKDGDTVRVGR